MQRLGLKDKVVLVTGAAGAFGRQTCQELAQAGARVVATDLKVEGAIETAFICREYGVEAWGYSLDVTSARAWKAVMASVSCATDARLDALVNNACRMPAKPFLRTSLDDLHMLLAVNLDSAWMGMQAAFPLLCETAKDQGTAAIVNVSSVLGQLASVAQAGCATAKGGLSILTKSVAAEFARSGVQVRVNAVHPGPGDTPLRVNARLTEPEDVADAVLFLCSDLSRNITGAVFDLDGGYAAVPGCNSEGMRLV